MQDRRINHSLKPVNSGLIKVITHTLLILIACGMVSCSAQGEEVDVPGTDTGADTGETDTGDTGAETGDSSSTADILCDLSDSAYNADESVALDYSYAWNCTEDERLLSTNGVPDHEVGTFDRIIISEQDVSANFTLTPVATDTATAIGGGRGTIAFAINGVKFDPGTAGTCDDSGENCSTGGEAVGQWRIEALGPNDFFGGDFNNAHVQPSGAYHYHGMPESLLSGEAVTLVGWAADGFPVYARYGYSDAADASSDIKVISSSYQLQETPDENRPPTDLHVMGTFTQDYSYIEGLGDLDECNGRFGVTPEFPEGIYHYYVTDGFPYMTRCVKGEVSNQRPEGGQGGEGGAGSPDLAAAAATLGTTEEALREALGASPPRFRGSRRYPGRYG